MADDLQLEDQPSKEPRKKPIDVTGTFLDPALNPDHGFPLFLQIKNSPRLWQFLKETGEEFERTPEEHARELLIDLMRRITEAKTKADL